MHIIIQVMDDKIIPQHMCTVTHDKTHWKKL